MDEKNSIYDSSYSSVITNFEQQFKRALNASSITGEICKIKGALSAAVALFVAFYAMTARLLCGSRY